MERKHGTNDGEDDEECSWKEPGPREEDGDPFDLPRVEMNREALEAECPAFKEAIGFLKEASKRKRGRSPVPPALHYVRGLLRTAIVGVHMGHYWAREEGHPHALRARYRIAANRFDAIARMVRAFPKMGLADLFDEATHIAAGFRLAARA